MAENTVESLCRAGQHGADFVEFDVQLTRDLIPVLYHDFRVNVFPKDSEDAAGGTGSRPNDIRDTTGSISDTADHCSTDGPDLGAEAGGRPRRALVKDLSFQELRSLRLEHSEDDESSELGVEALTKLEHREEVDGDAAGDGILGASGDPFPTLKEVRGVAEGCGYDDGKLGEQGS